MLSMTSLWKLMFVVPVVLLTQNLHAELIKKLPNTQWSHHFEEKNVDIKYKEVSVLEKTDGPWILIGKNPISKLKTKDFWLWKLVDSGKKIQEIKVPSSKYMKGTESDFLQIESVVGIEGGGFLFVGKTQSGPPLLVKMDKDGKILFEKELSDLSEKASILKIIATKDKHYFLIGARSFIDALILKVDSSGKSLWEKSIDLGKTEMFIDGIPSEDGGVILLGNSGTPVGFKMGQSNVFVIKYDTDGNIILKQNFPGRDGHIIRGSDRTSKVLFDKSDSLGLDLRVLGLLSDLKVSWENEILKKRESSFEKFKIAPVSDGGFLVAGSKENNLWVSRFNKEGKEIWSFLDNKKLGSFRDLFLFRDHYFIVYSMVSISKKMEPHFKFGIIKFGL